MIPPVGSVWEELDSTGWLVVSEAEIDPHDGTTFVLMVALYSVHYGESRYRGHIEGIPTSYLNDGWIRVS